jgi:hypothetical protein
MSRTSDDDLHASQDCSHPSSLRPGRSPYPRHSYRGRTENSSDASASLFLSPSFSPSFQFVFPTSPIHTNLISRSLSTRSLQSTNPDAEPSSFVSTLPNKLYRDAETTHFPFCFFACSPAVVTSSGKVVRPGGKKASGTTLDLACAERDPIVDQESGKRRREDRPRLVSLSLSLALLTRCPAPSRLIAELTAVAAFSLLVRWLARWKRKVEGLRREGFPRLLTSPKVSSGSLGSLGPSALVAKRVPACWSWVGPSATWRRRETDGRDQNER